MRVAVDTSAYLLLGGLRIYIYHANQKVLCMREAIEHANKADKVPSQSQVSLTWP